MAFKIFLLASVVVSVAVAQRGSRIDPSQFNFNVLNERAATTPVPILRSVDRQNPDGSYTYGFENGDGTYKIETRYATGEVKGKYGYYDPSGQLREVEYGASPDRGFEPRAEGLIVPPPTLVDETDLEQPEQALDNVQEGPARSNKFSNFSPRENSGRRVVVRKKDRRNQLPIRPRARPAPRTAPRPFVAPQQPAAPAFIPASNPHRFDGHPARNIDLQTGSYSIQYSG